MTTNEIKRVTALHIDKFRKEQKSFLIEGPKMLQEVLHSRYAIKAVYGLPEWIQGNHTLLAGVTVVEVSPKELSRISQLKTPNQVVTEVAMSPSPTLPGINDELVVALDNINNPGNLGTIIRTADWFGVKTVVCSQNCADFYNPKVLQATMGSFTRVGVYYTDLMEWLQQNAGIPVYGAVMDGKSIYQTPFHHQGILLIGNESQGISPALHPLITHKITIPTYGGKAESLNASIATAIILAEIRRSNGVAPAGQ